MCGERYPFSSFASNQRGQNQSKKHSVLFGAIEPAQMASASAAKRNLPLVAPKPAPLSRGDAQRGASVGFAETSDAKQAARRIEKRVLEAALNFRLICGCGDFTLAEFTKYIFLYMLCSSISGFLDVLYAMIGCPLTAPCPEWSQVWWLARPVGIQCSNNACLSGEAHETLEFIVLFWRILYWCRYFGQLNIKISGSTVGFGSEVCRRPFFSLPYAM